MRLGVDIDLTVVDTGRAWYEYLCKKTKFQSLTYDELLLTCRQMPYDMTTLFPDIDEQAALDFWRYEDVYDKLKPMQYAVEVLEDLKLTKGYEIVFVSTIKGNHHKSKYYFAKKHFPFLDGFIATKEKKYAKVDMMIDDRLNVLEKLDKGVIAIQKNSVYDQSSNFVPNFSFGDWRDLSKKIYKDF